MPKYIIEREIPGVGNLTSDQLKAVSLKSVNVISELGTEIQWLQSYVTGDKLYCVYIAANKEIIMRHAQKGGFAVSLICEISSIIDPSTGGY